MEAVLDAHAKVSEVEYRKLKAKEEAERKAQGGSQ